MAYSDDEILAIALSEARDIALEQPALVLAAEDMRRALETVRRGLLIGVEPTILLQTIDETLNTVRR